ncbi:hypothetical protein [Streptosporangium sp. NPDC001681]|uniref:hypothetical protein n=1 Tax=Streptosporangium sp. NPDC001681 TaxID=3154395 RepID=UPI00332376F6
MSESSGRASLARSALVGLVVGVVVAVIWTDDVMGRRGLGRFVVSAVWPNKSAPSEGLGGVINGIAIIVVPILLSGILARSAKISRWWPVALAGSAAFGALASGLFALVPFHRAAYGLPEPLFGIIFLVAGVAGYAAAAWMVMPRTALPRILLAGAMIAFPVGAAQVSDRVQHWHRVWDLGTMGVSLVSLDIPGRRYVAGLWRLGPEGGGPAVELSYRLDTPRTIIHRFYKPSFNLREEWEMQVFIRATAATPGQACAARYLKATRHLKPAWAVHVSASDTCRPLSDGRVLWIIDDRPVALFARHGDVLLQISSLVVTEAELLATTDHVRPTTARELLGRTGGRR